MMNRDNSARIGRLFLYINVFDQNRGFFALFRVHENSQEIAGRFIKRYQ